MLSVPAFIEFSHFLHMLLGLAQEGRHFLVCLSRTCLVLETQDTCQPVAAMGKSAPKGGESPSFQCPHESRASVIASICEHVAGEALLLTPAMPAQLPAAFQQRGCLVWALVAMVLG